MDQEELSTKKHMTGQARVTDLLMKLLLGEKIVVTAALAEYQITLRTLQRDIDVIRGALAENTMEDQLTYQRELKAYQLVKHDEWSFEEVLALLKVIIGSRAFSKEKLTPILNHLLATLSDQRQSDAKRLITDVWAKYVPVQANADIMGQIKYFSELIVNQTAIRFSYHSEPKVTLVREGVGIPLNLFFADYYFYVVMYLVEDDNAAVYRMDDLENIHTVRTTKIKLPREKKIDVGVLRNSTYLLPGGTDISFRFRYWDVPQKALDKLPNSRITHHNQDGSVTIEGDHLGSRGALLWVLSQGANIKVEQPQSLIDAVRTEMKRALAIYEQDEKQP